MQHRRLGYLIAIGINVVGLWILDNLVAWRAPFVTSAFAAALPAIDLAIAASVVANLAWLVYDADWFRHLLLVGTGSVSLAATRVVYDVFPFDFGSAGANSVAQFGLLLVGICVAIGIVVESVQCLVSLVDAASAHRPRGRVARPRANA